MLPSTLSATNASEGSIFCFMHTSNSLTQIGKSDALVTETRSTPDVSGSFVDRFADEMSPGRVIGSTARGGIIRRGVDKEGILGIDHGALRIQPLVNPGWGRAGVAYGPYRRRNGLAFGAFLINGHNISRTQRLPDEFRARMWRWVLGTETERPLTRLKYWVRSGQKKYMWRRLKQWFKSGTTFFQIPSIDENLSVGWFPSEAPADPLQRGNAISVHSVVPEGGELWAHAGSRSLRGIGGLQDVPMYYIVMLRERGAAYYAASIPGVPGLTAYPSMRLLGIDAFNVDETVYAGIHQSVIGEIGFRIDTRVFRTQVTTLPEFDKWYGSAHGADVLTGIGPLEENVAERGGSWRIYEGEFVRGDRGVAGLCGSNIAVLELNAPAGLVHLLIETQDKPAEGIAVIWRAKDEDNLWCFEVSSRQCQLSLKEDGRWCLLPAVGDRALLPNTINTVQVSDDGAHIRLYLNGEQIYRTALCDDRLQHATGVGIRVTGSHGSTCLRSFEAHPREIPIPNGFELGVPWCTEGTQVAVRDLFEGAQGDLAGHPTDIGQKNWTRSIGNGAIQLTGQGAARVNGSVERPCPGRTAYTVEWVDPGFADVEVTITPPGKRKGLREKGRAGLIFWQDARNYVTLSAFIGDFPAMSIAAFFQKDGFEELFDAVWSNVGNRMHWGVPHDFRVVFDGQRFLAFINREPVLYRALQDVYPDWDKFSINRVGIVANWEWGNDTGSTFQNFVARDRK